MLRDVACDDGEVEEFAVEEAENIGAGMLAVGEERSQWRIAPSEPPETRMGCTGCHARAVLWVTNTSGLGGIKGKIGHTANFFFVSAEDDPLFHGANIEHSHSLVA